MFAARRSDLRKSAVAASDELDVEVRALIDDLDQFFDDADTNFELLTDTQEIEAPVSAVGAVGAVDPSAGGASATDVESSLERAILDYIERDDRSV